MGGMDGSAEFTEDKFICPWFVGADVLIGPLILARLGNMFYLKKGLDPPRQLL